MSVQDVENFNNIKEAMEGLRAIMDFKDLKKKQADSALGRKRSSISKNLETDGPSPIEAFRVHKRERRYR